MGGFFGATSKRDVVLDVFFGVDYHSHLGTRRGGMAAVDESKGFQRDIHNIENAPFRTKFAGIVDEMHGNACIGCISDSDPQPLIIRSSLGVYAISTISCINNADELVQQFLSFSGGHFNAMTSGKINATELVAALINQKSDFVEGIKFAQDKVEGSLSVLILKEDGSLLAARDKFGRLPVIIGKDENGHSVSFESFAFEKLGYEFTKELGPGEIVRLTPDGIETLSKPHKKMRICAFLWTYYGYPNSTYEGINVEVMRNRNGEIMARDEAATRPEGIDLVSGVPDSGVAHALGYSNGSHINYARPFVKYTPTWPRSFMPTNQLERNKVAKMKLVPVHDNIQDKNMLLVDDSIVRGTQLQGTVDFLYSNGAKAVHMRSACPPIMYGCKYLNFSRNTSDDDLIARRVIHELEGAEGDKYIDEYADASTERGKKLLATICEKFKFASLGYQSINGLIEAIGLPEDCVCTYCWTGKE
ncbi:MAG: amidophosphoribosyltransferase [Clostridia bacterium]|nr:amidophosphoribosyltransferase [Clostridia bacterium]